MLKHVLDNHDPYLNIQFEKAQQRQNVLKSKIKASDYEEEEQK